MPNGHDYSKKYGGHDYGDDPHHPAYNCKHGCGCCMGSSSSSGPLGLDPFGTCPGNPEDGKPVGGKADYEIVVTQRIRELESRAYNAEKQLRAVEPSKIELAEQLASAQEELSEKDRILEDIRRLVTPEQ